MKQIFLSILLISSVIRAHSPVITYGFESNGRLGDKLILYVKAKWISYKYNLPLYFKPFQYSDQFMFSRIEKHEQQCPYFPHASIKDDVSCNFDLQDMVYEIHHFFKSKYWSDDFDITQWPDLFHDQNFINDLKRLIKPTKQLPGIALPKGRISVAVHVRKGGGLDIPMLAEEEKKEGEKYAEEYWPLKFPNDDYYIASIAALSLFLGDTPLYVYIFTDDGNPTRIMEKFRREINKSNIIFDCRREGNAHNNNVVEDFFAMTKFDCLIRSLSNYSQVAHLIGDFKIVISPRGGTLHRNGFNINQGVITCNNQGVKTIEVIDFNSF